MHTLAKRIHTITPKPLRLTFDDGSSTTLEMRSPEFFQESFQAEGVDGSGTIYRLVTDDEDDPLVAGKETDDGWVTVGEVVTVEPSG